MASARNRRQGPAPLLEKEPATLEELNALMSAAEPPTPSESKPVPGEGPVGAAIFFVGEQPGDEEDIQGRPFVGPAGRLLTRALAEARIDRNQQYLTNAVKRFKFVRRGKRRIHEKPTAGEVRHYRWWLNREIEIVRPKLLVALGSTALLALAGKALPIGRNRGEMQFGDRQGYVTVHPSYLLRIPEAAAKEQAYKDFVDDLRRVRKLAQR